MALRSQTAGCSATGRRTAGRQGRPGGHRLREHCVPDTWLRSRVPTVSGAQVEVAEGAGWTPAPQAGRPDGRATRWAGHRERRRIEFVDAALRVIEQEGPDAPVSSITAELGVGRPALYRQFEDRADLDRAVADRAADLLA